MQQVMKLMKSEGIHLACNTYHSRSVDGNSDAVFLLVIEEMFAESELEQSLKNQQRNNLEF